MIMALAFYFYYVNILAFIPIIKFLSYCLSFPECINTHRRVTIVANISGKYMYVFYIYFHTTQMSLLSFLLMSRMSLDYLSAPMPSHTTMCTCMRINKKSIDSSFLKTNYQRYQWFPITFPKVQNV